MKGRRFLLFVVMAVIPFASVGAKDAKPPKFEDVVDAHFSTWDTDGDGRLSAREINALVVKPGVTGDEAAAVAAIHTFYRDHAKANPVGKGQLSAPSAERKGAAKSIAGLFDSYRRHIKTAPREVFAGSGGPAIDGMHEGRMGDCYFLSVVGAAVHRDAGKVRQMFHPQADGSCEVVFPTGEKILVPRLTDAQVALGSTAGKQGLWLNVLEEAYSRLVFSKAPKKDKKPNDLREDLIARGGDSHDTLPLMTGHPIKDIDFKESKDPADLKRKLVSALKHATAAGHLMTTSTVKGKTLPPEIGDEHDYAVLGFDAKTEMVSIWNPWGKDFTPKQSPPGLKHGYETKSGRFEVSVDDFLKIFDGLVWETAEKKKK